MAAAYRAEIQGLRTVAAILIALHHVWFNRVSGGVDVFFVLSGFLITGSLTREVAGTGRIRVGAYLTRIARRLFPAAWAVLAASALGIVAVVSKVYWESHFADVRSATLYTANIRLAQTSVDYLAQDVPKSPVQHFWAMSIQGQFYVLWPLVVGAGWFVSRRLRRGGTSGVALVLGALAAASFVHSVTNTADDPAAMYFDTFARVWEFALGGLLALGIVRFRISRPISEVLGTGGLAALVMTGVVTGGIAFPGWVAALPVAAALAIIVAGNCENPGCATRLLRWRPLEAAGDYSYAFFLWHWPLLTLWLAWDDSLRASVSEGVIVLLAAGAMSWVSVRLVERPFGHRRSGQPSLPMAREWALASLSVPALLLGTLQVERSTVDSIGRPSGATATSDPSASTLPPRPKPPRALESLFDPGAPIVPDPLVANKDLPLPRRDGCIDTKKPPPKITPCIYGTPGGPSLAIVGGSHAIQWTDALDSLGKRHGWEVLLVSRPGCRYGISRNATCDAWTKKVREYLLDNPPDAVFTTGTTARKQRDIVGPGYVDEWRRLERAGITVIAIRDNPEMIDPAPACVEEHRTDPSACEVPRGQLLSSVNPLDIEANLPANVVHFDLTEYWCTPGSCLAVVDNTLVYRDRHHLTATFVATMVPVLERVLVPIMAGFAGVAS